jgi:hypothetical protein
VIPVNPAMSGSAQALARRAFAAPSTGSNEDGGNGDTPIELRLA